MMYEQMIEQWEDDRSLYVERRNEMQRNDEYGPEWQAVNIRIAMIDEFIAFLKRCATREVEIQEAEVCDCKIENLRETEWNRCACRVLGTAPKRIKLFGSPNTATRKVKHEITAITGQLFRHG